MWTFLQDVLISIKIQCYYLGTFNIELRCFLKVIVIDSPLGEVKYHAIHIESEVRGSTYVH